jgi:uncharacterized membrane protein YphA (DoxX/SURF4 family)
VRRLYSTFAGGWPGIGLLVLRLVSGAMLVVHASTMMLNGPQPTTLITSVFLAASATLLISGLWTPIAGTIVAVIEVLQLFTVADPAVSLLHGTIGGALAMLGPGLWSVDARLFGWKRVEMSVHSRS